MKATSSSQQYCGNICIIMLNIAKTLGYINTDSCLGYYYEFFINFISLFSSGAKKLMAKNRAIFI